MLAHRQPLCTAALLLAALAAPRAAPAQHANFHHYTNSEGLPQRQTLALLQDRSGYVWFGTYGGLSRYDGASFTTFTAADGLSSNVIQALAEDTDGNLVVGTIGGGVCLFDGQRFECRRVADGLPDDTVQDLLRDRSGSLWIATDGGLARLIDGRLETFAGAEGLPAGGCTALAVDAAGTLWVGTLGGLARWAGTRFELVSTELPPIRSLAATDGELLIGTEAGLWSWTRGGVRRYPTPELLADAWVSDVAVAGERGAWAATRAGVLSLDPTDGRWLTRRNGLISDLVHTAMVDREGSVWFGTDAGTSKLVPGPFDTFTPESGLPHAFVRAVALDAAGRVWAGTRAGVGVLDGSEIRALTVADGLVDDRIYSLAPLGSDTMAIGTSRGLVLWRDGPRRTLAREDGLPGDQVASLEADGAGGLWVGTTHGLAHLTPQGRLESFHHPAVDGRYVMSQRLDADGRLWLGMRSGGVVVLDGDTVTEMGQAEGLTDQTIWSLAVDREGRMWVATNGDGLFGVLGDELVRLTTREGLVNDFVWQVFSDRNGDLWAYTNQGLDRWNGRSFVHYGLDDGLVDLEGSANAVLEDRDGNLWLGTASGLVRYVARRAAPRRLPPQVVIQGVTSENLGRLAAGAELPYDSGPITFQFAGLAFRQERAVEHRHRLLGLSDHWSKPSAQRRIQFASLPPGAYEFQVLARNAGEDWSAQPASFRFTVAPAYWHRFWFRGGAVLAIAALVALAVLWRTRRLESERQRLESLVAHRTAELQERTESLEREVATRREAQLALRLSEERVRDILEHSTNLFYSHTPDHVLTYVSPQTRAYFDCEPEEALRRWTELATDHPLNQEGIERTQRAIDTGTPQPPYELQLAGVKGRKIWVRVSEAPVVRDGRTVAVVGALTDITEAKEAEEERKEFEERLHQGRRLEAVGRLAGGIAHDFNNLLTTILGYAELLSRKIDDDPELAADLAEIRHAGESASALTQQLLAFSRKQVIRPEVLDVNQVIASAVSLLRPLIGEDIELETRLDPSLGPIKADRGQLEQILVNLAINARDAMPSGGLLTLATADRAVGADREAGSAAALEPGRYVCIEVSDTGTGMDEATLAHCFEPFFSTKQLGQGTGLGLATVYGIVKQNQGHVFVESAVGEGAVFSVYLPVTEEEAAAPPHQAPPDAESATTAPRTVLVVEDDASVRSLAAQSLRKAGFAVLEAADGQAALDVAARHRGDIDLLLTDLVMPGLNGREVAERLREHRDGLKVLFMSGYPADVLDRRNVRSDPSVFLPKPFSLANLVRQVRTLLDA